jgi:hypothetical protein
MSRVRDEIGKKKKSTERKILSICESSYTTSILTRILSSEERKTRLLA